MASFCEFSCILVTLQDSYVLPVLFVCVASFPLPLTVSPSPLNPPLPIGNVAKQSPVPPPPDEMADGHPTEPTDIEAGEHIYDQCLKSSGPRFHVECEAEFLRY